MRIKFNYISVVVVCAFANVSIIIADQESVNRPYVQSSITRRHYAKCVPEEPDGWWNNPDPRQEHKTTGRTYIYKVGEKNDELILTLPWYTRGICLIDEFGDDSLRIVRLGPWYSGTFPRSDHLAIEFYRNDKMLKSYSTLDIVGTDEKQARSLQWSFTASHYKVLWDIGYNAYTYSYDAYTFDKDHKVQYLSFDLKTGEMKRSSTNNAAQISH